MFLVQRPSPAAVERFLEAAREMPLSYDPIGLARGRPPGFTLDEHALVLGVGDGTFTRATRALTEWRHFDLGWVEIVPRRGPIEPGTVVAVIARYAGLWSMNGCRVVYSIGDAGQREFGFAYGTLTDHAECGEEIFKIAMNASTGEVSYVVRAASKPNSPLVWLGYPVVRMLQARFRRDSAQAVRRVVNA